ncbi:MAG: CAP domain-containing protein [Saprospiraceae bacterium]|nr:CAP domain-containing protein [Saprospiraceae bacterium]
MKHLFAAIRAIVYGLLLLSTSSLAAQSPPTPPSLGSGLYWDEWWYADTPVEIEAQFNAARRHEESDKGLTSGILGYLNLPGNFLTLDFKEQALILVNAERAARDNVYYQGYGTALGLPYEGVELDLADVAQGHADDMQANNFFGHTSSTGASSYSRISSAFDGCIDNYSTSENIAWNSYTAPGGFISGIALAVYNFIYDDACCGWGHRKLCLKQTGTNNYAGTTRFGMIGFGRSTGANGDFFVMDFFDPKPVAAGCDYSLTNFEGSCPTHLDINGTISSGMYQATMTLASSGIIPTNNAVEYVASSSITINPTFEVVQGSELTLTIEYCYGANAKVQMQNSDLLPENPTFIGDKPTFRIE